MSPALPARQRPRAHTGEQAAELAIFAATERLLEDSPLHELSVAKIITEAGLSRASFYHYFSSKFEVVAALMARIWDDIFSETHTRLEADWDDPGAALRTSLATGMERWTEHRSVIHAVLENQHAVPALAEAWAALSGRFVAVIADQIVRERATGRAVGDVPPETIATMLVCGAERVFYVGSTGSDERLVKSGQRLDVVVTLALAAIYGTPVGPAVTP
ncbi:MAG: putative TetR family transcriptional regulator [Solirubrobacterales bacterium]|nr:putative TetR family transcriptional regulator [Solirubrobacterales bacterium]